MALEAVNVQDLLKKLADDQKTYFETLSRVQELLGQSLDSNATPKPAAKITADKRRRNTGTTVTSNEVESVKKDSKGSIISAGNEDDDDDDDEMLEDLESLFAFKTLEKEVYDTDGFRKHLREYPWTPAGRQILGNVLTDGQTLTRKWLFPTRTQEVEQRGKHLPYYSVLDVGLDGAPLPILSDRPPVSRAVDIWERIRKINADPTKERKAVGRITIIHEPSPLLFGALHYTMSNHFDVDELFQLLVDTRTEARPHRPFSLNSKHRNTFVWTMEYFTIVGEECRPMEWQRSDENLEGTEGHIPVTRCASVIALSLKDQPKGQIRNKARRQERKYGDVYDPFSPWHVLSMQAYPDWKSSIDTHKSSKNYVNGPEAFLTTLRTEFKDAQKRLREVYRRISELVATPPDFMFRQSVRDKLLFEDDEFTYSRRYFWAYQSLGVMNEDIQEMISAYHNTFSENVWSGTDKIIWPNDDSLPSRYTHWRKRMAKIRRDIEAEIHGLELINRLNEEKMKEVRSLRDNLFSGTSVLESRRSVQQQEITVQQGHNIKLLTLVTIFFLPLTFVTSVFGMTNMNPNDTFVPFGISTACICIPTYLLIGSLNTNRGLQFWSRESIAFSNRVIEMFVNFLALFGYKSHVARHSVEKNSSQATSLGGRVPSINVQEPRSLSVREQFDIRELKGQPGLLRPETLYGMSNVPLTPALTPTATMERATTVHFTNGLVPNSLGASSFSSNEQKDAASSPPNEIEGEQSDGPAPDRKDQERGIWNRFLFRRRHSKSETAEPRPEVKDV